MRNNIVPRVGALSRRKPTYKPTASSNLNLSANKKMGGLSEDDIAGSKGELQSRQNLREFRATTADTILASIHIKTIESGEIFAAIMLGIENHNSQHEYSDDSHIPFSQERNCDRACRRKNASKRYDTAVTFHLVREWD